EILARTEKIDIEFLKQDGDKIVVGDVLATLEGKASKLLSSERTMLNMLQHASGIATMANKYVTMLDGIDVVLLDTRKTR
ncbi:nicotinate-nucleotide diphosphorylase (carboxylating), partial [Aliarcobacter butzleri]